MKLAIIHYHLNQGGVTRVIENHLRALEHGGSSNAPLQVLVLYGGRRDGWLEEMENQRPGLDLRLCPVAGLDYDALSRQDQPALSDNLIACLKEQGFSPAETLLHIHNHSLGKNAAFPRAMQNLAQAGYRLLLQIHDFAEDFRPANYRDLAKTFSPAEWGLFLYPQAEHIHYAVLNRRDFLVLESAGVPKTRLHFLPNPVPEVGELPDRNASRTALETQRGVPGDRPLYLYPVRGIRRKNVGEMLLWSAVHQDQSAFGMTLAPENPREQRWYGHWKQWATENRLACWWEIGGPGGLDFRGNLAAADAILTTSVAEGFGMVFLEAWLADRPLLGRNLPKITADFVEAGLRFPTLYDRLNVPADWIVHTVSTLEQAINSLMETYARPPLTRGEIEEVMKQRRAHGMLDFGSLDEESQTRILRTVHNSGSARAELLQLNPQLAGGLEQTEELISHNREIIRRVYSLEGSQKRLRSIYAQLEQSRTGEIQPLADPDRILASFLNLTELRLIRA